VLQPLTASIAVMPALMRSGCFFMSAPRWPAA